MYVVVLRFVDMYGKLVRKYKYTQIYRSHECNRIKTNEQYWYLSGMTGGSQAFPVILDICFWKVWF